MNNNIVDDKPLPDIELNDYRQGDEDEIVNILSTAFHNKWGDSAFWRWKHRDRPGFDKREIITASVNGKIVGCFHGATLPLQLEPGLVVPMSMDGDFAVQPEYRGCNIPAVVHDLTSKRLKDAGVALRGGFTTQALNERFYRKKFGYVFIPTISVNFRKIIGIKVLRDKIEEIGNKILSRPKFEKLFADYPVIVNFEVEGFGPFHLHLSAPAFHVNDGFSEHAQAYVRAPYYVIMNPSQPICLFMRNALVSMLKGRLRIRGIFKLTGYMFRMFFAMLKMRL